MIYLDHNATTPVLPEVVEAMLPFLAEHFGNPSSGHAKGRTAKVAVDKARESVADLIGAKPQEIVFTSGGTEANNLAIRGVSHGVPGRIVSSVVEHPATEACCQLLERSGWQIRRLPVDHQGRVQLDASDDGPLPSLVTIMHSNNETGTIQPISALRRRYLGGLIHTDAAQSVGKVPIDVDKLDVDLLSIAGHKLYAPKGVGALFVRQGTDIQPVVVGAGHEGGLRPGTENVPYIVGLGLACAMAKVDMEEEMRRVRALRDSLWERLRIAIPGMRLNGDPINGLPNTLNVCFPGVIGSTLLEKSPSIAASTGSACHEHGEEPSKVLSAMGVDRVAALGAVRLSLGRHTSADHVARAADELIGAYSALRSGLDP